MTSLDILPKGFDKAVGLKALLEDGGLQISDMLFIGDAVFEGGNDYSPVEAGIETIGITGPEETAKLISALLQG
jgi:hydroxymethylpyrimidine pyrophosphatase-like HAD family hydrolase